jgi:hypothetical protein
MEILVICAEGTRKGACLGKENPMIATEIKALSLFVNGPAVASE